MLHNKNFAALQFNHSFSLVIFKIFKAAELPITQEPLINRVLETKYHGLFKFWINVF